MLSNLSNGVNGLAARILETGAAPGFWVVINWRGQTIHCEGYGWASIEDHIAADASPLFNIASIGKMFAATLATLSQRDGVIDMDVPISRWIQRVPVSWKAITFRHLLTHTSGLKEYLSPDVIEITRDYTDEELLQVLYGIGFNFEPGASWLYSNSGYLVAGLVLSTALGRPYWLEIRDRIFQPLGMTLTRLVLNPDVARGKAVGYERANDGNPAKWVPSESLESVADTFQRTADGSFWATVSEFAKWDLALRNELLLRGQEYELLTIPSPQSMSVKMPYGMGFAIENKNERLCHWHNGAFFGFVGGFERSISDDASVAVFANADGLSVDDIVCEVSQLVASGV